jgi:hypothetical protein
MQTASELLGLSPPAPLSATLVARPVRACVFVPSVEGVAWQRLVEHALAAQTRIWGGQHNLVVPTGWELADDDLFWCLIERFDPDVIAQHVPTYADVEEIAPGGHADANRRLERELDELGFDPAVRREEIERRRDYPFWDWRLSAELHAKVVDRIAPLWVGNQGNQEARSLSFDGTTAPSYPTTDVAALRELPNSVLDIRTTLGDVDQLMLTHAVGRLLPSFRRALEERDTAINDVSIQHEAHLLRDVWPRGGVVTEFGYPRTLSETGVARRLSLEGRERAVVVVGDEPRDFLLYHGLNRLRPQVYWLPGERIVDEAFSGALVERVRHASQFEIGGGEVAVTTAASN